MTIAVSASVPQFFDLDGSPLDNGYIYFGSVNQNPETSPVTVYWDVACTQPVLQPVRTLNGFPSYKGKPANIYANSDYSTLVRNKRSELVVYTPIATQFGNAGQIGAVVSSGQTVTLNVPSQYSDVKAAMDAIQSWVILGTVVIQIADGTYNWTRNQNCNHPYGQNIKVLGNQTTPGNVIIRGPTGPTFDMFTVSAGNTLGFIDGMTIDLPVKATLANNTTAILATQGSTLITGNKIIVNNWYYGIAARDGSYIYCPNAQVSNAGDVGIWAFCGSTIVANGATSNYASDMANGYGFGFQGEFGSTLVATGAKATGCYKAGFAALSNSTARIHDCESYSNVGSGFLSWAGGQVEAWGSSSHDNQRYGIEISEYGNIIGVSTNTNNTLGAANNFAYFDTATGQARVATSGGQLRLDAGGNEGIYFHNAQGLQFSIGNSTAPTNRLEVRGGGADTGNQPMLNAIGTDADISIRHDAKGAGSHFFNNGNGLQFAIGNAVSAVNHVEVVPAKTGESPYIRAVGSDSVVDLALYPQGAGSYIRLGAGFVSGAPTPNGYIWLKINDGSLVKVPVEKV